MLTRNEGGFSDVKQGKTIKASLYRGTEKVIDSQDLTWKVADEPVAEDNSSDEVKDDGATAVTTFGAAFMAAVASLLF